jgi:hypothetical protein
MQPPSGEFALQIRQEGITMTKRLPIRLSPIAHILVIFSLAKKLLPKLLDTRLVSL